MKLAMTVMVRDEADIIRPMIEHHLDQGVDTLLITDNGSVDGTREILEDFAKQGFVRLYHDPVQRKQQSIVVTRMAREAATTYQADWVINADADEFWMAQDPNLTLKQAIQNVDPSICAFVAPVVDMTGPPALAGSGLQRLVYRDHRNLRQLNAVGLHAHSTPNVVHIGDPAVEVAQGNHSVSVGARGEPDPAFALEVLHYPWRSWAQFSRKVENAGRAYESNSGLTPSPEHHGMRDYERWKDGSLFLSYLLRCPRQSELALSIAGGSFVLENKIADLRSSPIPDDPIDEDLYALDYAYSRVAGRLEGRIVELEQRGVHERDIVFALISERDRLGLQVVELNHRLEQLTKHADSLANRRLVRAYDRGVSMYRQLLFKRV